MMRDTTHPRLIVNADDYGRSEEVNASIERSCAEGIVTSTTVMINMPAARQLESFRSRFPRVSIGLHVNLTEGRPILPAAAVPSLVDSSGVFPGRHSFVRRLLAGRVRSEHMRAEISAQVEALTNMVGDFSHFDSHQHTHLFTKVAASILHVATLRPSPRKVRTSRRIFISATSIPRSTLLLQVQHCLRHPLSSGGLVLKVAQTAMIHSAGFASPDYLLTPHPLIVNTHNSAVEEWSTVFSRLPSATIEMNCHPGMSGDENILCDPRIRSRVTDCIELISYAAL